MAVEQPLMNIGYLPAGADLSAKQFYAVKVNSSKAIVLAGAGENALGVLQNDPTSGQAAEVMVVGVSKVKLGATVVAGENVMADAAGKLVPATGVNAVLGVCLQGGDANEIGEIALVSRTGVGNTVSYSVVQLPIVLSKLANGDILTTWTPGFAGTIHKVSFAVTDPATTAAKAAALNLEIGTTNVTGGVVSLTSANCTPLGAVVDGTAITAANTFGASDTLSVEASGVTAFVEGAGVLLVVISN